MLKALQLEPEKCTGCLQCEMACSYENEGVFNPSKSRIKVFNFHHEGRFAPYTCTQCSEAWCLHACPVEAIVVNEATGAKEVIEDVCVGGKVMKCDLCGGDPACVTACPTEAITYVDSEHTGLERMRSHAAQSIPQN